MSNGPLDNRLLVALAGVAFSLWGGTIAVATSMVISRIEGLEVEVSSGILPRADERITVLERDIRELRQEISRHLREEH